MLITAMKVLRLDLDLTIIPLLKQLLHSFGTGGNLCVKLLTCCVNQLNV